MMKKIAPLIVLSLWITVSHAQVYGLEELNDSSSHYMASKDLQRFLQKSIRHDLDACATECHLTPKQRSSYFAAVPISIDNHNKKAFLVFPSQYCSAFFGAHAIAYWIIAEGTPNNYRFLYEGKSDAIELLDTYSHGKKDLRSHYGSSYIVLRFNGKKYRQVGSGDFSRNERALTNSCSTSQKASPSEERRSAPGGVATNTGNLGLSGTSWQLLNIGAMADGQATITVEQSERYTLHFLADGRLALRMDCNRGNGSWQATPTSGDSGQLSFGTIASTRMFCPPPSLDSKIAHDLGLVRSYRLRDGHLLLSPAADGPILEWAPAPIDKPRETQSSREP